MSDNRKTWHLIATLGPTQILTWGALYYAIAILAPDIGREMGWRAEIVFGAFSWCLLFSGIVATPAGIWLDRYGGRYTMTAGSLLCGTGLIMLSQAHSIALYYAAWTVLGAAMALTLYEAAFATIIRETPQRARQSISTLTLFGGFASTIFWPLTLLLNTRLGWRDTYLYYGLIQLLLVLPLHALLPARPRDLTPHGVQHAGSHTLAQALREPTFWKLAFAFAGNSFIFTALSVHLITLLQQFGHAVTWVVFVAAMIGPTQVAGRVGEMMFGRRTRPQTVGMITFGALPAALLALVLMGTEQWAVALFCLLYGLSNGIVTIVRGAIPQALFGSKNYGAISGAMSGPALILKAAAPLAVAAIVQRYPLPQVLLCGLLAVSVASLSFYVSAIKAPPPVL
ncbi:MAG TPA: MFS transporter [Burkholderiaceae bacterium]